MSVDNCLVQIGLVREYWHDPKLRVLVQLFLNLHKPASGLPKRFLSCTVIMTNPRPVNDFDSGSAGYGRENVGMNVSSTGIVREAAGKLLESAITGRVTALLLPAGQARAS